MDDCRMLVEYVAIITAPTIGTHLGLLTLVILAVGLAVAVAAIVALVTGWSTVAAPFRAATQSTAPLELAGSREPQGRARARAPSVGAVLRA